MALVGCTVASFGVGIAKNCACTAACLLCRSDDTSGPMLLASNDERLGFGPFRTEVPRRGRRHRSVPRPWALKRR